MKAKAPGFFQMLKSVNRAKQCYIPEEQNPQHGNHSYGISYLATYSIKIGEGMLQQSADNIPNGIFSRLFMLTTAYLLCSLSKVNHITDKYRWKLELSDNV